MPGTGHSHRFKSSISSRNARPRFNVLAPWSARKTGAAGDVAVSQGGDTLIFKQGIGMAGGPAPTITTDVGGSVTNNGDGGRGVIDVVGMTVGDFIVLTFASPYATIPLVSINIFGPFLTWPTYVMTTSAITFTGIGAFGGTIHYTITPM